MHEPDEIRDNVILGNLNHSMLDAAAPNLLQAGDAKLTIKKLYDYPQDPISIELMVRVRLICLSASCAHEIGFLLIFHAIKTPCLMAVLSIRRRVC
jgi:hypothetical protein